STWSAAARSRPSRPPIRRSLLRRCVCGPRITSSTKTFNERPMHGRPSLGSVRRSDMIVGKRPHRCGNEVRHQIGALAIVLGAALVPTIVFALECPVRGEPSIPPPESIATPDKPIAKGSNIDTYKRQLIKYHDGGNYIADIAAVMDAATAYVLGRANEVRRPAVVLDIDETSLSNWDNLKADDFGFIEGGTCSLQEKMPWGFSVGSIGGAIARSITTLWNLDRAGFNGWAGVATRPDDQHGSIVPFKSGERDKVAEKYTIVANIGDQDSDLEDLKGKSAECSFKLPNPYYFIP